MSPMTRKGILEVMMEKKKFGEQLANTNQTGTRRLERHTTICTGRAFTSLYESGRRSLMTRTW